MPHRAETYRRRVHAGVVLILHDTTVLDYSGLTEIEELGQVGMDVARLLRSQQSRGSGGHALGVWLGVSRHCIHAPPRAPGGEKSRAAATRDRESRLWKKVKSEHSRSSGGRLWWMWRIARRHHREFLDCEEAAGKKYGAFARHNRWMTRKTKGKRRKEAPRLGADVARARRAPPGDQGPARPESAGRPR